jgi:hypothetical protein
LVAIGDTVMMLVEPGSNGSEDLSEEIPSIDLGFGEKDSQDETSSSSNSSSIQRLAMWGITFVITIGAVWFVMNSNIGGEEGVKEAVQEVAPSKLYSFSYEKVEASSEGIYRYALSMGEDNEMRVEIDDVPKEKRHIRKSQKLSADAVKSISLMLVPNFEGQSQEDADVLTELFRLDKEYTGTPVNENKFDSVRLKITAGTKVFSVSCENTQLPAALATICERLETFSKNEMGMWAIQYSGEKLMELSAKCSSSADAKWEERDVQYGNLAAALALYNEAIFYLETVNPKPEGYEELCRKRDETKNELEKRYRDQRFLADRAINLADWETAQKELRILCQLVPDKKDPRNKEATKKLVDVESRIGKGGSK